MNKNTPEDQTANDLSIPGELPKRNQDEDENPLDKIATTADGSPQSPEPAHIKIDEFLEDEAHQRENANNTNAP